MWPLELGDGFENLGVWRAVCVSIQTGQSTRSLPDTLDTPLNHCLYSTLSASTLTVATSVVICRPAISESAHLRRSRVSAVLL